MKKEAGFEEIDHTADWALRVWAPTLEALMRTAMEGMYTLSGIILGSPDPEPLALRLASQDPEMLLVDFLSELVYLGETGRGAAELILEPRGDEFAVELVLAPIVVQMKEIKAVTYHGLEVRQSEGEYEATLVFDV